MNMSNKTTGVIVGAVSGAVAGSMLAVISTCKKPACSRVKNTFTRTTSHLLEAAGTVMINLSDMLK